ncbi:enhancer of mRNA-decapping protein 4 isoform X2 [Bacillus rossius redtenbacheri]|uniref:enhancer of mRNA-decapping protein 4 isoform X2 n=1 Tax=Bacillus rossius redtenbacheri TaxID=93214 RepID=UPI002FDC7D21
MTMDAISTEPPAAISASPSLIDCNQIIRFAGADAEVCRPVVSTDVTVVPSAGDHDSGSSKMTASTVVDFCWDVQFHAGHILAVHMSNSILAYGVIANNTKGAVRVVNRKTGERTLLRGMLGKIKDIAFSHEHDEVVVASVDEFGNLFVYEIQDPDGPQMVGALLLSVMYRGPAQTHHRVIWCPYIPEEDPDASSSEVARLLVLIHGARAELWNVAMVARRHGKGALPDGVPEEGFLEVGDHDQDVVDASFSPDGTALATASRDGYVKFFQVYMHDGREPRCLHKWQPHGGRPLASFFFLDNHRTHVADAQFWKFVLTGADNNSELKIWSCESWTCLQTIRFSPEVGMKDVIMKAGLDLSAQFLLLTDLFRKVLYVMQIHKDAKETKAYVSSVIEVLMPCSMLGFGIVDACIKKFKNSGSLDVEDACDETADEPGPVEAVVLKIYHVQPKSLQDCQIVYQLPSANVAADMLNSMPQDALNFIDNLVDLSSQMSGSDLSHVVEDLPANRLSESLQPANHSAQQQHLKLMTPDAFNSPAKKDVLDDMKVDNVDVSPELHEIEVPPFQREIFTSGGSSPSREVQEILALNQDYFEIKDLPVINQDIEPKPEILEKLIDIENDQDSGASKPVSGQNDGWPEVPRIPNEVCKSVAAAEETIINMRTSLGYQSQLSKNDDEENFTLTKINSSIESALSVMQEQVNSLTKIVKEQNSQIKALTDKMTHVNNTSNAIPKLEDSMTSLVEVALEKQRQQQSRLIDELLAVKEDKERKRQEALMSAISQSVGNLVTTKLDEIVMSEINSTILPGVVDVMESLKQELHSQMSQKLATTDHLLKENIANLVNSKAVLEVLGQSLVATMRPLIQGTYKDIFASSVVPAFENVCQNMFQQINQSFSAGTKEYAHLLDSHMKRYQAHQEKEQRVAEQLQSISQSLTTSSERLAAIIEKQVQHEVLKGLESMEEKMSAAVSRSVADSMAQGFQAHQALIEDSVRTAVRSRAVTPAPQLLDSQHKQNQILHFIKQGHINSAFQEALSAANLSLVMFVCERVNPQQVFSQTPCPLRQNVLLSLVQQLCADMSNYNDIKHSYLQEAVTSLDPTDQITREHLPTVLSKLVCQLNIYMTTNPNNKLTRGVRMVCMAAESLLSKI